MIRVLWAVLVFALAGCGGGGGGNGQGFTLSSKAVNFSAAANGALPPAQSLQMHITNSKAAYAGAAYRNGETQPSWLQVEFFGATPNFEVRFSANSTSLTPGSYISTISLGIADEDGNILGYEDVRVTYVVQKKLAFYTSPAELSYVIGAQPINANVGVSGDGIRYRASSNAAWLRVPAVEQTAPNSFTAIFDGQGLSVGRYSARLNVTNIDSAADVATQNAVLTVRNPVMNISTPSQNVALTFGSSDTVRVIPVSVEGDDSRFTVSSSASWLAVPTGELAAPGNFTVTVDSSGLGPGIHEADLTLFNRYAPSVTARLHVRLTVALPVLSFDASTLILGGSNGLSTEAVPTTISLSTGSNKYRWSVSVQTDDGASWLSARAAVDAKVGATGSGVVVESDHLKVRSGFYQGRLVFSADVLGQTVQATLPVRFNAAKHLLFAPYNGVALTKLPSRQLLVRSIPITTNLALSGIPWSATSNQPWLTVTRSGQTGEELTLTADPTALAADSISTATVTLTSSLDTIENQEIIQVGLWNGSADPLTIDVSEARSFMTASPTLPYAYYVTSGGNQIKVLNIYTGSIVATWSGIASDIRSLTVSSDGKLVFAQDGAGQRVIAIDAATGASVSSLQATSSLYGSEMLYLRPNGHPTLIAADSGEIFDIETRQTAGRIGFTGRSVSASADGKWVWGGGSGYSPDGFTGYPLSYSSIGTGGGYQVGSNRSVGGISGGTVFSNCRDIAVSPDGKRVYAACGAPYAFGVFDGMTSNSLGFLPADAYPNSATIAWNGHFFGGIDGYYSANDVWEYDGEGNRVGVLRSAPGSLTPTQLLPSGDLLRVITISTALRIQDAP